MLKETIFLTKVSQMISFVLTCTIDILNKIHRAGQVGVGKEKWLKWLWLLIISVNFSVKMLFLIFSIISILLSSLLWTGNYISQTPLPGRSWLDANKGDFPPKIWKAEGKKILLSSWKYKQTVDVGFCWWLSLEHLPKNNLLPCCRQLR